MLHRGKGIALLLALATITPGCATVRDWTGFEKSDPPEAAVEEAAVIEAPAADPETELRAVVRREIEALDHTGAIDRDNVIRRRPYWLKEYVEYPDDASNLEVQVTETESRTKPFIADVKVPKVRFATKLHRDRQAAQQDTNFYRHTGTETLTYEYRNGRWVRVGSLFVADASEENVGGQWVQVQPEEQTVLQPEEEHGWFGRTWRGILGR